MTFYSLISKLLLLAAFGSLFVIAIGSIIPIVFLLAPNTFNSFGPFVVVIGGGVMIIMGYYTLYKVALAGVWSVKSYLRSKAENRRDSC